MTRGRKPVQGVSAAFFREPILIALHQLTDGNPHVYVDYFKIENLICRELGIDVLWKGRQPQTNRPLVRVWIGSAMSKLRADQLVVSNNTTAALTNVGVTAALSVKTRIENNPQSKPALPNNISNPPPAPSQGNTVSSVNNPNPNVGNKSPEASSTEERKPLSPEEEAKKKAAEEVARIAAAKEAAKEAARRARSDNDERIRSGKAVEFAGIVMPVQGNVPADACLPMPESYMIPKHGSAAKQIKETAIAFQNKRSTYIWGLPGSGKDAFVHAYSHLTRTPAQIFTVSPNEDIQSWFFIRSFENGGTGWEEGEMLRAVRDGYTTPTGEKVPYLILISDLDRATKNQAEALRLVMDTIQGRVMGPGGKKYPVLPGTQIVATANSSGSGDTRGRCVSSNVLDASILDRFERKFKFDALSWEDEVTVLKNKFPVFDKKIPGAWTQVGDAVNVLRKNVEEESIFAEFGHRSVCSWVGHAQDILVSDYQFHTLFTPNDIGNILRRGSMVILDAMPDEQTRLSVQKLMDPYIKGGAL